MVHKAIIFFDGICNFCNSSVNFIIKRDKKNYFKFASLQSEYAQNFLELKNLPKNEFESIILLENNKIFQKSTAALKIAKHLNGFWKIFYILIIIPSFIRNFFYDIIAKNRYKWFGKRESCMIPDEKVRDKFLN
jgi:predicted DCC family thiol-disulfide oxidoreductase YuxK